MSERCAGWQLTGYWKGYPCGNDGKYEASDGKKYCHAHYTIAEKTPERFQNLKKVVHK